MKNLKLTTWDRIQLVRCIPNQGSITDIAKYLRLVDVLELSESEGNEVGLREFTMPGPQGMMKGFEWNDQEREFDLTFEDADFGLLQRLVAQYNEWPRNPFTLELKEKLEEAQSD